MKMKFCLSLGLALILAGCYGAGYYGDYGYPYYDQDYFYDYPYYWQEPFYFGEPYGYYNFYSTPYVNPYHQYHRYFAPGGHEQHFQPGGGGGFNPGGGGGGFNPGGGG
ncbi:MAG: hypothetical protein WBQ36_00715, partial [Desulfobaccales bacterium]